MQVKLDIANVSDSERLASALGGALLAAYGISQRSKSGTILAAAGGALIVRGATGYCPGYAVAGIDMHTDDTKGRPVDVAVTIAKPHDEVSRFWSTWQGAGVVGSVRFTPHGTDETEVRVSGEDLPQTIREDLRRFKALIETGEVPTTKGQPRGGSA